MSTDTILSVTEYVTEYVDNTGESTANDFDLPKSTQGALDELIEITQAQDYGEAVRDAVGTYKTLCDLARSGYQLAYLSTADGTTTAQPFDLVQVLP